MHILLSGLIFFEHCTKAVFSPENVTKSNIKYTFHENLWKKLFATASYNALIMKIIFLCRIKLANISLASDLETRFSAFIPNLYVSPCFCFANILHRAIETIFYEKIELTPRDCNCIEMLPRVKNMKTCIFMWWDCYNCAMIVPWIPKDVDDFSFRLEWVSARKNSGRMKVEEIYAVTALVE